MKKRILSVLLVLCMLCALLPMGVPAAQAYSETDIAYPVEGGNIYFDKATGMVTDCDDSVTSADIPATIGAAVVSGIGDHAFYRCGSLTTVTIPYSVRSIGESAFGDCSSLTGIWVSDGNPYYWSDGSGVLFETDSAALFQAPGAISGEYTVPDGIKIIYGFAFMNCSSLTGITISDGVTGICWRAFSGCSSLASVTLPDSLTDIGSLAFENCSSLTDVTIPGSVSNIYTGAFSGCTNLNGMWVADSNLVFCSDEYGVLFNKNKTELIQAPGSILGAYRIPDSVTKIGEEAFYGCKRLTGVMIPNSVTHIDLGAFSNCSSLTSVTIPDSVTNIYPWAFDHCSSLTAINVSAGNRAYASENGVLFTKDRTKLVTYPCGKKDPAYKIPEGVTSIGKWAFYGCSNLTNVTIPEGLKDIGWYAFMDCSNLESVTLSATVTSIDDGAFCDCRSLTSVSFSGNAPSLGYHVFYMSTDEGQEIIIPGLTIYFIEGKRGWTTPTWNGVHTVCREKEPDDKPVEFVDVAKKAWYYEAVEYAVTNGLMNGVGNDRFDPEGSMTRAMLVTVLWRYEGEPEAPANTFSDVKAGSWYFDAVSWAAANNIVGGVGNNKFDPDGNITREQMATILYRYCNGKGIDTSKQASISGFPDAGKVSSYAQTAMQWAVAERLVNGSDGKLLPQGNATRAQVATILMRFIENIAE